MLGTYLDGNAAAGDMSTVLRGPGVVARCAACGNVLLRFVTGRRVLYLRGLVYLSIETPPLQAQPSGSEFCHGTYEY